MATNNAVNSSLSGTTGSGNFVGSTSPILVTPTLGAASATSISFSSTSGVIGTTTNNDAAAGSVGQYISSTVLVGSAVSLTNNTPADITSISLTAGDWDVWGNLHLDLGVGTNVTLVLGWSNTTSATIPTVPNNGLIAQWVGSATNAAPILPIGYGRYSLASTTTIYLSVAVLFTVSTAKAYGFIGARRRR